MAHMKPIPHGCWFRFGSMFGCFQTPLKFTNLEDFRHPGIPHYWTLYFCKSVQVWHLSRYSGVSLCFSVCSVQDKDIEHNHLFKGIKNGTLHGLVTNGPGSICLSRANNMISDDLSLIWEILRPSKGLRPWPWHTSWHRQKGGAPCPNHPLFMGQSWAMCLNLPFPVPPCKPEGLYTFSWESTTGKAHL